MKKGFVRAAAAPGAKSVLILEAPASSSLPASPQVQQQPLSCEAVRGGVAAAGLGVCCCEPSE